jgi:hypothetical protein
VFGEVLQHEPYAVYVAPKPRIVAHHDDVASALAR